MQERRLNQKQQEAQFSVVETTENHQNYDRLLTQREGVKRLLLRVKSVQSRRDAAMSAALLVEIREELERLEIFAEIPENSEKRWVEKILHILHIDIQKQIKYRSQLIETLIAHTTPETSDRVHETNSQVADQIKQLLAVVLSLTEHEELRSFILSVQALVSVLTSKSTRKQIKQSVEQCREVINGASISLQTLIGESRFVSLLNELNRAGHTDLTFATIKSKFLDAITSPETLLTIHFLQSMCLPDAVRSSSNGQFESSIGELHEFLDPAQLKAICMLPRIVALDKEHSKGEPEHLARYLLNEISNDSIDVVYAHDLWHTLQRTPVERYVAEYLESVAAIVHGVQEHEENTSRISSLRKRQIRIFLVLAAASLIVLTLKNSGESVSLSATQLQSIYANAIEELGDFGEQFGKELSRIPEQLETSVAHLFDKSAAVETDATEEVALGDVDTETEEAMPETQPIVPTPPPLQSELSGLLSGSATNALDRAQLNGIVAPSPTRTGYGSEYSLRGVGASIGSALNGGQNLTWTLENWEALPTSLIIQSYEQVDTTLGEKLYSSVPNEAVRGRMLPIIDFAQLEQYPNIIKGFLIAVPTSWSILPHPSGQIPVSGVVHLENGSNKLDLPLEFTATDGGVDIFYKVYPDEVQSEWLAANPNASISLVVQFAPSQVDLSREMLDLVPMHAPIIQLDQLPQELQTTINSINTSQASDREKLLTFQRWFNDFGMYSFNDVDDQFYYVDAAIANGSIAAEERMAAWVQAFFHGSNFEPLGLVGREYPRPGAGECKRRNVAAWAIIPLLELEENWSFEIESLMLDPISRSGEDAYFTEMNNHARLVAVHAVTGERIILDVTDAPTSDTDTFKALGLINRANLAMSDELFANAMNALPNPTTILSMYERDEAIVGFEVLQNTIIPPEIIVDFNHPQITAIPQTDNSDMFEMRYTLERVTLPWHFISTPTIWDNMIGLVNFRDGTLAPVPFEYHDPRVLLTTETSQTLYTASYELQITSKTNVVPVILQSGQRPTILDSIKISIDGVPVPFVLSAATEPDLMNIYEPLLYAVIDMPAEQLIGRTVKIEHSGGKNRYTDRLPLSASSYAEQYDRWKTELLELGLTRAEVAKLLLEKTLSISHTELDAVNAFLLSDPDMDPVIVDLYTVRRDSSELEVLTFISDYSDQFPTLLSDMYRSSIGVPFTVASDSELYENSAFMAEYNAMVSELNEGKQITIEEFLLRLKDTFSGDGAFEVVNLLEEVRSSHRRLYWTTVQPPTHPFLFDTSEDRSFDSIMTCGDLSFDEESFYQCLVRLPIASKIARELLAYKISSEIFQNDTAPSQPYYINIYNGEPKLMSLMYTQFPYYESPDGYKSQLVYPYQFNTAEKVIESAATAQELLRSFYAQEVLRGIISGNPKLLARFLTLFTPLAAGASLSLWSLAYRRRWSQHKTIGDYLTSDRKNHVVRQQQLTRYAGQLGLSELSKPTARQLDAAWTTNNDRFAEQILNRKTIQLGLHGNGKLRQPFHSMSYLLDEYRNQRSKFFVESDPNMPPTYITFQEVLSLQLDAFTALCITNRNSAKEFDIEEIVDSIVRLGIAEKSKRNSFSFLKNTMILENESQWKDAIVARLRTLFSAKNITVYEESMQLIADSIAPHWKQIMLEYREYNQ